DGATAGVLGGGSSTGSSGYIALTSAYIRYRSNTTATQPIRGSGGPRIVVIHNAEETTRVWAENVKSEEDLAAARISQIRYISPLNVMAYGGNFYGCVLHTQDILHSRRLLTSFYATKTGVELP